MSAPAQQALAASAYASGYLEGAMRTLLLRLEYDSRENLADFIRESLVRSKEAPR